MCKVNLVHCKHSLPTMPKKAKVRCGRKKQKLGVSLKSSAAELRVLLLSLKSSKLFYAYFDFKIMF